MRFHILLMVAALAGLAGPASAQSLDVSAVPQLRPATSQPAAAPRHVGFRVYGFYESVSLSATQTFDGLFGTSSVTGGGAGGEVLDVWQGVFVRAAFSRASLTDGSRGFVINGQLVLTNVPLEVRMSPLEFGAGWRQPLDRAGKYVAYGGLSLLRVKYTETAEFETTDEHVEMTDSGYAFFGGLDALVWREVFLGAEVQFRTISDALGQSPESISGAFGETNLGGTVFRLIGGVRW